MNKQRMKVGCAQKLQRMTYLNGGRGGVAIFNQDSMKTAVIIPALHTQGAKTSEVFVIKSDFLKNMSSKYHCKHQLNEVENK